jgi:hypothetical protein
MTLRAHHNVISLAEWRRMRGADEAAVRIVLSVPPGVLCRLAGSAIRGPAARNDLLGLDCLRQRLSYFL